MFVVKCLKYLWEKALEKLGRKKYRRIVVLGIDDSGKTTLITRLNSDRQAMIYGAGQYNSETSVELGRFALRLCDEAHVFVHRNMWRGYAYATSAIIFMMDSSNHSRFQETKEELNGILALEQFKRVPILILGNKIDKLSAESETYLRQYLGLPQKGAIDWQKNKSRRPIQIFMCTIGRRMGYIEGLKWLISVLPS